LHTRSKRDWSSDVCSSDLFQKIVDLDDFRGMGAKAIKGFYQAQIDVIDAWLELIDIQLIFLDDIPNILQDYELDEENFVQSHFRSEERRVGKEGRSRWVQ